MQLLCCLPSSHLSFVLPPFPLPFHLGLRSCQVQCWGLSVTVMCFVKGCLNFIQTDNVTEMTPFSLPFQEHSMLLTVILFAVLSFLELKYCHFFSYSKPYLSHSSYQCPGFLGSTKKDMKMFSNLTVRYYEISRAFLGH